MAPRALALCVFYPALAFRGRAPLQLPSIGSTGFKG